MNAWIACSDELPEHNEHVLWCRVPVVEPYVVASMCSDEWDESLTHWMPPPGPPGGSDQPADAAGAAVTEAMVTAALDSWYGDNAYSTMQDERDDMRAALAAALAERGT